MRYRYGRSKGDLQGANMTKRQIQSLVCQVMVLSDRVDKLERLVEGLRKGDKI